MSVTRSSENFNQIKSIKYLSTVPTNSTTEGSELITDPGIEAWDNATTPTNYDVTLVGAGASIDREDTEIHSGTYSAKSTTGDDGGDPGLISQTITGTPGDTYKIVVWGKVGTANSVSLSLLDAPFATATQAFDFDTWAWIALEDNPGASTISEGDWADTTEDFVPLPASGSMVVAAYATPGEGANKTAYIDDFSVVRQYREVGTEEQIIANILSITKDISLSDALYDNPVELYTVPTGYELLSLTILIKAQDADTITEAGTYSIGTNDSDYDNIFDVSSVYPDVTGAIKPIDSNTGTAGQMAQGGDVIKLKKITEWDAEESIATIYLVGALIKL